MPPHTHCFNFAALTLGFGVHRLRYWLPVIVCTGFKCCISRLRLLGVCMLLTVQLHRLSVSLSSSRLLLCTKFATTSAAVVVPGVYTV